MVSHEFRFDLDQGAALHLERSQVNRLLDQLRAQGLLPDPVAEPLDSRRTLEEEDPRWGHHSGSRANHIDPPEWDEHSDLELAAKAYGHLSRKVRVFTDLLIDHPGRMLSADEICAAVPDVFENHRAIAGCLNGYLKPCRVANRRFPFYWWDNTPTDYAMKLGVARLLAVARDRWGDGG
jgi:hypothetical protein